MSLTGLSGLAALYAAERANQTNLIMPASVGVDLNVNAPQVLAEKYLSLQFGVASLSFDVHAPTINAQYTVEIGSLVMSVDLHVNAPQVSIITGNIYQINNNTGSDSNDGLSAPWKNITKISSGNFQPGDKIRLDENSTWREQTFSLPTSGTAGNPITIESSGPGYPKLWGAALLTGFTQHSGAIYRKTGITTPYSTGRAVIATKTITGFVLHSGAIYKKTGIGRLDIAYWQVQVDTVALRRVTSLGAMVAGTYFLDPGESGAPVLDGDEVLYVWLSDGSNPSGHSVKGMERLRHVAQATGLGGVTRGSFWLDDPNNTLYAWMPDDASPDTYDSIEWPTSTFLVNTNAKSYWNIRHIQAGKGGSSSFSARTNCSHINFIECWSYWAGLRGFDFGGSGTDKSYVVATDCLAHDSPNENYWCGLATESGYDRCESHHGAVDQPNGYTSFLTAGHFTIGVKSLDCFVTGCYDHDSNTTNFRCLNVEMEAATGNWRPIRTRIHRNRFHGNGQGTEEMIRLEGEDTEFYSNECWGNGGTLLRLMDGSDSEKIWNNTFYNVKSGTYTIYVLHNTSNPPTNQPVSPSIKNNIIYAENGARMVLLRNVLGTPDVNYNDYFVPSGGTVYFSYYGTLYTSLAAWSAATGFDAQSVSVDPAFSDLAAKNFRLTASTPAAVMNSGFNSGVSVDRDNVARDASPSMGAYEYVVPETPDYVTYYFSEDGNDAWNGTSLSTPWRSLSKITAWADSAPAQFALNRGDRFHGNVVLPLSGESGRTFKIVAYGSGNLPIIDGTEEVTGWTLSSGTPGVSAVYWATWNNHGNPRSTAEQVLEDNEGSIYRYFYGTSASLDRPGSFFVDITTHRLYVRCTDNASPTAMGRVIRSARTNDTNSMRGIVGNGKEHWDFENLQLFGQAVHGFSNQVTGSGYFNFTGCKFSWQGTHGIRMYPSGGVGEVHSLSLTDCDFDHILGEAVWSGQTNGAITQCDASNCGINRNALGYGPGTGPNLQIAGVFNIGSNSNGTVVDRCQVWTDDVPAYPLVGWTLHAGSVYKITSFTQVSGTGEKLWQEDSGVRVELRRDTAIPVSAGGYFLDDGADTLYLWCSDDGDPTGAGRWIWITGQVWANSAFNAEWETGLTRPTNLLFKKCKVWDPNGPVKNGAMVPIRSSGSNVRWVNLEVRQNAPQNLIATYNGASNTEVYFSNFYMEHPTGAIMWSNSSDGLVTLRNNIFVAPVVSGARFTSMTAARYATFDADYNAWVGAQVSAWRDTADRNWAYFTGTYGKEAHGYQLTGANTAAAIALVNWTVDPPTAFTFIPDADFALLDDGIAIVGVTDDIDGNVRSDPPEIGSRERV